MSYHPVPFHSPRVGLAGDPFYVIKVPPMEFSGPTAPGVVGLVAGVAAIGVAVTAARRAMRHRR